MKKIFTTLTIVLTLNSFSQSLCSTVGKDSTSLITNGYITGNSDGTACTLGINTESKWVKTKGVDSITVFTFQHRKFDKSRIYDENNNLIWFWDGESVPAITWYEKYHRVYIGGNDSIKLEFYTGFGSIFCLGLLQITKMNCGVCYEYITVTDTLVINTGLTSTNPLAFQHTIKVYPNPTNDHVTIDYGNYATLSGYTVKITNSLGQTVFNNTITTQTSYVNLSTWSGNGLYFIHLIDPSSNTIDIRKIVLQ